MMLHAKGVQNLKRKGKKEDFNKHYKSINIHNSININSFNNKIKKQIPKLIIFNNKIIIKSKSNQSIKYLINIQLKRIPFYF